MMQKFMSVALACVLCLGMTVPVYAAEQPVEIETAGAYLRERGVYQGDSSGNLMLNKGLTHSHPAPWGGYSQSRSLHLGLLFHRRSCLGKALCGLLYCQPAGGRL